MKDSNRFVIWPAYLDARLGKGQGRKLKRELCVENPSIYDIKLAAERLELGPELEPDKKYPKNKDAKGVVVVDKKFGKLETLRKIAAVLKKTQ